MKTLLALLFVTLSFLLPGCSPSGAPTLKDDSKPKVDRPTSMEPGPDQERALQAIKKLGGKITRVQKTPDIPVEVIRVDFTHTGLTDAGLKDLAGLTQLQVLNLTGTRVTDVGLKDLAGFTKLQVLNLAGCEGVTDAGLKDLAGFKQLKELNLEATRVTDAGLKELAPLTQLQVLNLTGTRVTDAGLKDLAGLTQLRTLTLYYNIGITEAGKKDLKTALPQCEIRH